MTGIAVVMLLLVVGLISFRGVYDDRVYPAISVADVELGGLHHDEARSALAARADQLETGTVTFIYEDITFSPSLNQLGVTVQIDKSLDEAWAVGREPDAVERLRVTTELLRQDRRVPLAVELNEQALDAWFDEVDADLGLNPHDAYLHIEGDSVRIEPEVEGRVVDRLRARELMLHAIVKLEPVRAELPTLPWVASVRSGDLAEAEALVAAALSSPVELTFGDRAWSLSPSELSQFIVQDADPALTGVDAVRVRMDDDALATWLSSQFAAEVYLAPVDARVGWNGAPVAIASSVDGHQLRPRALATAVSTSFFGGHDNVSIPVDIVKPRVDSGNLEALGITTRISSAQSNYSGSDWGRSTNISVGSNLMNGFLVPPGGEFSFHRAVGLINKDRGFVEARVIQAERIGTDVGGGICQVSTTIFRAAVFAGLPVTEWWPHDYRIEFYERDGWGPGWDASILQPHEDPFSGGDFKFLNPTDSWLLIESWADGARVTVNIYGPELGWDVKFSETQKGASIPPTPDLEMVDTKLPAGCVRHTELPEAGLEVWWVRQVFDQDGELLYDRKFYTRFKPRGNVWRVSPDMQGASPARGGGNWGNCN